VKDTPGVDNSKMKKKKSMFFSIEGGRAKSRKGGVREKGRVGRGREGEIR